MQTRIRMGKGKIEVAQGDQDGVPVLIFAPNKEGKAYPIGKMAGKAGSQISAKDLNKRNAVVIEFPDYAGLDVVIYELAGLWKRSRDAKWDG